MESRTKILSAAARVYSELGFRGATTRRIAKEADVNEVTIFRIFGSKAALMTEALRPRAEPGTIARLPDRPRDPERELTEWAAGQLAFLRAQRSLIRKTMGEIEERPEFVPCASDGPREAHRDLKRYLASLTRDGWVTGDDALTAAPAMLLGAIFSDAMGRDMMQEFFPRPLSAAPRSYARLFLRAIGLRTRPLERNGRKDGTAARSNVRSPKVTTHKTRNSPR